MKIGCSAFLLQRFCGRKDSQRKKNHHRLFCGFTSCALIANSRTSAKWRVDLQFYTIGYEGADLFDFLATLKHAEVSLLVDIRELPASRRKGFSKNALQENLESVGIQYIHLRDLGDPKEGRLAARTGNFKDFR